MTEGKIQNNNMNTIQQMAHGTIKNNNMYTIQQVTK